MTKLRNLGNTDLQVSPICIGSWQLAGPVSFDGKPDGHPDPGKGKVLKMISKLHDLGLNHIDTAEQYGEGEAERRIGEAVAHNRDEWVISTKFGYRVGPGQTRIDDSSPPTILKSLEGSLKRLKTDRVEIFLYHCAPDINHLDEAASILEKARTAGKVRYFGISTPNLKLAKALHSHGLLDVWQIPVNLLEPKIEHLAFAAEHGIGVQARGVMAQGRLSGRYLKRNPDWHPDDNRRNRLKDIDLSIYAGLQKLLPTNLTMAQAAVLWALSNSSCHTICLGAKALEDYLIILDSIENSALPPDTLTLMETWSRQVSSENPA